MRKGTSRYRRCWCGPNIINLKQHRKVKCTRAGELEAKTRKGNLLEKKKEDNSLSMKKRSDYILKDKKFFVGLWDSK